MLRSKLERFLAGRLILFFVILTAVDIIFIGKRWLVLAGLIVGVLLNLARLSSMVRMLEYFTLPQNKRGMTAGSTAWHIAQLVVTLIIMALSVLYSIWLFAGVTMIEIIIPLIIIFYSITDTFGLTHSNLLAFEGEFPESYAREEKRYSMNKET